MATEWNYEDLEAGCVLSIKTVLDEEFEGRVVSFHRPTEFLILQAPESGETRYFNTIHIRECTRVGRSEDPLRESAMVKAVFMARLRSGSPFLQGLIAMREISSKVALIVRDGEIELRICNRDATSLASLVLQAETMLPTPTGCFAFRCDVNALTSRLLKFVEALNAKSRYDDDKPRPAALLEGRTVWIYKTCDSGDICFLIGLHPHPFRFTSEGETQLQTDLRALHLLPVKVILSSDCFRGLLDLSDSEQAVSATLLNNFVLWESKEKQLRLDNPTECSVQGSLNGKPRRLGVEFIHPRVLFHASYLSKAAVMSLVGEEVMDKWIMFLFPIDRGSVFIHLMRGLKSHLNAIELKKISPDMDLAMLL